MMNITTVLMAGGVVAFGGWTLFKLDQTRKINNAEAARKAILLFHNMRRTEYIQAIGMWPDNIDYDERFDSAIASQLNTIFRPRIIKLEECTKNGKHAGIEAMHSAINYELRVFKNKELKTILNNRIKAREG